MLFQVHAGRYQPLATFSVCSFHQGINQRLTMNRGLQSQKWTMQSEPQKDSSENKVVTKLVTNIFQGKFGQRGEVYVLLQFLLVSQVVSPPSVLHMMMDVPLPFNSILFWAGLIPLSMGMGLAGQGSRSLGENLTPWPKPTEQNQLTTDGAYALCRHPIYGGLLLACLGLSMTTASPSRFLFAAALFVLMDKKAARFKYSRTLTTIFSNPSLRITHPSLAGKRCG
jgi:protein-S-isoprenylcysteine O-methyltransferase Ste14